MTIHTSPTFKVILVSENINYRNILASKLRLENFHIELALGGFHLLHLLEKEKDINMLICHGDMNDMSALEMIAMARQGKPKQELPIVFIAPIMQEDEVSELISIGANEYMIQTSNFNHIIERTQKYFQQMKVNAA